MFSRMFDGEGDGGIIVFIPQARLPTASRTGVKI
jgi:hypothetical protein